MIDDDDEVDGGVPGDSGQRRPRHRHPEHRWPAALAVLAALAFVALAPSSILPLYRYVLAGVGAAALLPLIALNPVRLHRQTRWSRPMSLGLSLLLLLGNQVLVVALVIELTSPQPITDARALLLAALQVWLTNAIAFALVYWELDRGGPIVRSSARRHELPDADFRFPQDEDRDTVIEVARGSSVKGDWRPAFVDYFAWSMSTSMAFSPSDAMPLTSRAKILGVVQAFSGFVILALVIARSVGALGG